MSEYAAPAEAKGHHVRSPISVLWVVAASILSGLGLVLLWWFLEVFQLVWLGGGILLVLVGCLMFMDRRAGWDHA
jgi:hypothetical protein